MPMHLNGINQPSLSADQMMEARIVIVDDMQLSVDLLTAILRKAGFTHIRASIDPFEGLAMCQSDPPDLVLLDYCMPGLDGPGFLERLRGTLGADSPPVLFITAENNEAFRRRAMETGAIDFLPKPYTSWELLVRARNLLIVHLMHRDCYNNTRRLEAMVLERTAELERTQAEIILRLCSASEFRDDNTGRHIARIGPLAGALAELAGLDDYRAKMIASAAPLHDIGKLGVPDRVLLKPGRLDELEWAIMQTHSSIGARILAGSGMELLDLASEIALTHHEKWDGSGYPQGLSGENIPIAGRIVAVCDVFDALLSPRPYKAEWGVQKVLRHLAENAGSHLDPTLTHLFLSNADRMITIREAVETSVQRPEGAQEPG
jgi:putative two-component system response regulator